MLCAFRWVGCAFVGSSALMDPFALGTVALLLLQALRVCLLLEQ